MDKNSDYIFKAFIVNSAEYDNGNKETSGAWLYFPTDAETVKQTLEEIGLPENASPDTYFFDDYVCGINDLKKCLPMYESIDALNYLAERISELEDIEMRVFQTAIKTKDCHNITDAINITYNIDYYKIIDDISDWTDYGKYIAGQNGFNIGNIGSIVNFIDFEAYGKEHAYDHGVYLLEGIFVETGWTEFNKVYDGNLESIPSEYLVTEYSRKIKFDIQLQTSMELAMQIDDYLREHSAEYVSKYIKPDEPPVYISDCLMNGDTLAIKDMLTATNTLQGNALIDKICEFEQKCPCEQIQADNQREIEGNNMSDKMKVLVVEPMQEPYIKEIDAGLKSLQKEVDGNIQAVYPFEEEAAIICNEEGKINGLELNRALYDEEGKIYDIVAGTFLICGLHEDNFGSLQDDLINKFSEQFKQPEQFFVMNGEITAIPVHSEKPSIKQQLKQSKKEHGDQEKPKPPRHTPPEL